MKIPAVMLITPDPKYGRSGLRKYVRLRIIRYKPTKIMMNAKMHNTVCAAAATV